ncbi:response regulator transcription factor [bacterium SCSIO 12741]|nr:response regulator transcription factor [bacterium SCSIO 12741]
MKQINLVIADDHLLFRKGLVSLLSAKSQWLESIESVSNGRELLELLERTERPPDVVLLDLEMPEINGQDAAQEIMKCYPSVKIIMLSMYSNERLILKMIESGISGYLLKNASPQEVEKAIISVIETGFYYNNYISEIMRNGIMHRERKKSYTRFNVSFTDRELDVLKLICKEHTATEIAEKLYISPRTVEGHKKNLLSKAGTKNTAGLVIFAIKNSLVQVED